MLLAMILAAATAAPAPASAPALSLTGERRVLDNGLVVIVSQDRSVPGVSLDIRYRVGSRDEEPGRTGFAHLFEHLMFMGAVHVPYPQFDTLMEAAGGVNNASTSNDRTNYFEIGPSNLVETFLWMEADRMATLDRAMTGDKLKSQRLIVQNERRQSYENRPYGMADLAVEEQLFPQGHPYSWSPIGSHADLEAATLADVVKFFQTWYVPNNAVMAVVGDVEPARVFELAEKYFSFIPRKPLPPRATPAPYALAGEKRVALTDKVELEKVVIAWPSPAAYTPGDANADLLASVLGRGKASRLYERLVHKDQIATEVNVYQNSLELQGIFQVEALARPGHTADELARAIDEELALVLQKGVTVEELDAARSLFMSDFARRLEGLQSRAETLTMMETYYGDPNALPRELARYSSVTPASVVATAKAVLVPGRLRIDVKPEPEAESMPAKSDAPKSVAESATAPDAMLPGEVALTARPAIVPLDAFEAPVPREIKLKNGLRILLVQKAHAPIEALAFVARRGATSDPEGKAGLLSLTAAMLEAGSAKKSQSQIAALADSMGATLRTGATSDGVSVTLSGRPEKLSAMAGLLADLAMKPNFDEADWQKVKSQRLAQLDDQLSEPRVAAQNAFLAALYGEAPLGRAINGTPESVKRIDLAGVKGLWSSLDPGEIAIVAVGAASEADVVRALSARFSAWKPGAAAKPDAAAKSMSGSAQKPAGPAGDAHPRLVFVEFPDRPQTVLRVGQPSVPLSSPDSLALRVLNSVLGGSFTSRLNQNLREKNGYSYGANSSFAFGRGPGPFAAATSVKTEVTGLALGEILKEIALAVNEPLSAADVEKGKALLAYQLVQQLERADSTAGLVSELFLTGSPLDSLRTRLPQLKALTAAGIQAAALRSLDPKTMTITVVGGAKQVLPQLTPLGLPAPQFRTATGERSSGK